MNYVSALSGKYAITFPAWLLLSPVSIFLTYSFTPEGAQGTYFEWMILGFIGHAVTGAVLLLGWLVFSKLKPGGLKALLVLLLFAIAGATRGFSVGFFGDLMGLIDEPDYLGRIRSGSVLVLVWFSFAAVLIETNSEFRTALAKVRSAAEASVILAQKSKLVVANYRVEISDQVRGLLETALSKTQSATELTKIISQVLKPLINTERLSEFDEKLKSASDELSTRFSFSLRETLRTMFTKSSFNGVVVAFVYLASTASSRLWVSTFEIFVLDILINSIWIIAGSKLAARSLTKLKARQRIVAVLLSWLVLANGAGIISETLHAGNVVFTPTSALFAIAVLIVIVLTSALDAYRLQHAEKIAELSVLNAQLDWYRRSIHQALWVEKRRLTRLIHSQVQSRILATAARVARQNPDGKITAGELDELKQVCLTAIYSDEVNADVAAFLEQMAEVFSGASEIVSSISDEAQAVLSCEPAVAAASLEIIREGINNAVKHGKANRVEVKVNLEPQQFLDKRLVAIEIFDDGNLLAKKMQPGIGQKTLDELAIDWKIFRKKGQTLLQAKVPVG